MVPALWLALVAVVGFSLVLPGQGIYLTGTKFPWENCKQRIEQSVYTAYMDSYFKKPNAPGWTMCWTVQVQDQEACNIANGGVSRCCNTDLNKFRVWPALKCKTPGASAVQSVTIDGKTISRFTWDLFNNAKTGYTPQWALKITPLALTPQTAHNYQICINLRPPCATMEEFANDGQVLEYALYDRKRDNYECCPVGFSPVQTGPFSARK